MGRPRIIETAEEFDRLVDEYFRWCVDNEKAVTFAGMARHLGFASRQSFYDYGKNEDFSYSVKRAQLMVEEEYEARLSGNSPTGAIFALKNHGWSDKQGIEHSGSIKIGDLEKMSDEELAALAAGNE